MNDAAVLTQTVKHTYSRPSYRNPVKPWARWNTFILTCRIFSTSIPAHILIYSTFGSVPGAVIMITGNAILRQWGYQGYASHAYATVAGIIGGAVSYNIFPLYAISFTTETWNSDGRMITWWCVSAHSKLYLFQSCLWMVYATTATATGGAILWSYRDRVDLGDTFDLKHAMGAGILGAVVFLPLAALFLQSFHAWVVRLYDSLPILSANWRSLNGRIQTYWETTEFEMTTTEARTTFV